MKNVLQNQKGYTIVGLRSDHEGEFESNDFVDYCKKNGINHSFLAPRISQQNEVIKSKSRCLKEMARTILNRSSLPKFLGK